MKLPAHNDDCPVCTVPSECLEYHAQMLDEAWHEFNEEHASELAKVLHLCAPYVEKLERVAEAARELRRILPLRYWDDETELREALAALDSEDA